MCKRAYMSVSSANWKEELQKYIGPDNLPEMYGGNRREPDAECSDYVSAPRRIPHFSLSPSLHSTPLVLTLLPHSSHPLSFYPHTSFHPYCTLYLSPFSPHCSLALTRLPIPHPHPHHTSSPHCRSALAGIFPMSTTCQT